jgi:pseudouridine-5'-phosphate glycosidase
MTNNLTLHSSVKSALETNSAIIALESTVIAHGLPRPQNLETAESLEQIVRDTGAIPATIAILSGALTVGLTPAELRFIAETDDIKKISIRDLPLAIAQKWNGATTVATTCWIAERAGVRVFATGGIGGVHRGALNDISADLPVLANTSVILVCSGAKIILDLTATREWLETNGVTIVGYRCDELPAFYSRSSGLPVDIRVDSPEGVVEIFRAQQNLGVERALLVTVPVPEEFEIPSVDLERTLQAALREAEKKHVGGRELTPFLLSFMASDSEGATLRTNIALLENNARVAGTIAVALQNRDR